MISTISEDFGCDAADHSFKIFSITDLLDTVAFLGLHTVDLTTVVHAAVLAPTVASLVVFTVLFLFYSML